MSEISLVSHFSKQRYNDIRLGKLTSFEVVLQQYPFFSSLPVNIRIRILRDIERGCFNEAIEKAEGHEVYANWNNLSFTGIYHDICYNLLTNLDVQSDVGSMYLIDQVRTGKLEPKSLAHMSCYDMCPDKYIQIKQKINEMMNAEIDKNYTKMYRCRICKENKCTVEKRFNRSFDEGINQTITCCTCGHSWNA